VSAAEQLSYAPLPYRVRRRIRETSDTWTLELDPVGAAIELLPGQFTMLYAFGVGEVPISVSGDLTGPGPLVHTIRAVGSVTERLCALRRGDVVGVRGPFGRGWPLELAEEHDLILVAGGVGLPPLRPVLYDVLHHRGLYDRVALLYGARTPADLVFRHELEQWRAHPDLHVDWTVDVSDGSCKEGLVTTLVPGVTFDPANTVAFACGPEIMMRNAVRALAEHGLPPENVYVSLERNMRCGVGLCGHCQLGPTLVCRDGPVYAWPEVAPLLAVEEL
jgi:NAD(P)H-flavin reductase